MRAVLKSHLSLFWVGDDKKQRDDVCMGSSLSPLSTNIIMTDLDGKLRKPLISNNTINLYARYVEHILFIIKREDVCRIQNLLNNFDLQVYYRMRYYLDLQLFADGISIFKKNTNNDVYTHFSSYMSWTHQTAWIKCLTTRASLICSPNKLSYALRINYLR